MTDTITTSPDEAVERHRLADVIRVLESARARLNASIDRSAETIQQQKELIWAHQRDMDHAEKAAVRVEVDVAVGLAEGAVETRRRVEQLIRSPYFGRVDFHHHGQDGPRQHYIGLHSFRNPDSFEILIHDWRAPVSSLYYDFELGEAHFEAPEGTAYGEITGKRQYKIEHGELEFMLESSLNIGDELLQRELSRSADDKMKNIVATIQREQNAVIRNESAEVLILQGVAGSGKTSIALHRVAFLLYRFKDTLSSDNVMILSPNKVFGDYISGVLPELGEEQIAELDAETIATRYLSKVTDFETFGEQVAKLLDGVDDAAAARMRYKATPEFVTELGEWVRSREETAFTPVSIEHRGEQLPAEWVEASYQSLRSSPIFTRLDRIADAAVQRLKQAVSTRGKWTPTDTTAVKKQVTAMFPYRDAFAMYRAFYEETGRPHLFVPLTRKRIEYADVFPLIFTMITTSRRDGYPEVRHLLIDEMQDYTPIQYAVLRRLFACKMTILGDANQSVNPFSSSSLERIRSVFPAAECLELTKSYRSTVEITEFTQNISRNDRLTPVDRHGTPPRIIGCRDNDDERRQIIEVTEELMERGHRSIAIIAKTAPQAEVLHRTLTEANIDATLLDYRSTGYEGTVIVTSAHIAKGLEFDAVIVPHVNRDLYATETDRSILYIACTRAMHELVLTHEAERSGFLASSAVNDYSS